MEKYVFLLRFVLLNSVICTDVGFNERLNERLVVLSLKKAVLNGTLCRVQAEMKAFMNTYTIEQFNFNTISTRLTSLERSTQLLKEMTVKPKESSFLRHSFTMALAEHKTGNFHLIDTSGPSRWLVKSPRGILGVVYHPISEIFFIVASKVHSGLYYMNSIRRTFKRLMECSLCLSLDLDTKKNILYFLAIDRETRLEIHLQRIFLRTLAPDKRPHATYAKTPLATFRRDAMATSVTVDERTQSIYVLLRGRGIIVKLDYTGGAVGQIALNGPITHMTHVTVAVDKVTGVLYYSVNTGIWRNRSTSNRTIESELIASSAPKTPSVFVAPGSRLLLLDRNTGRIDEWVDGGGITPWLDLGGTWESSAKYLCFY